MGFNLLGSSVI